MTRSLTDTDLFRAFVAKSEDRRSPLDPKELQGMLARAARELGDVLNRACTNFEDYTLHDVGHAVRIVELAARLLGPEQVAKLNSIELALLILAAYGHDIGMAVARGKREELEGSTGYKDYLLRHEEAWLEAEAATQSGNRQLGDFRASQLFQDFLRSQHHVLSAELVEGQLAELFVVEGKTLARPLALLCRSHGESVAAITKLQALPFAGAFEVDLQFLACVLRLADYLDLDSARAPRTLFQLLEPGNERSRREWRKHQASNFFVSPQEIRFAATFQDFFEEKALRDTIHGIDVEREECMNLLRSRPKHYDHELALHDPIARAIDSQGYLFEEFRFQLDYQQIMSLLMGTRLYRDEKVFVRELLQNALDACRHAEMSTRRAERHYSGRIIVRRSRVGDQEVLEVSDNGTGMTRAIIRDYFMRVGRSYYQSYAFRQKRLGFDPVSQFGIGVLSCFMKGRYLEVETRPDPTVHGADAAADGDGLKLEIRGAHQYFVVRRMQRPTAGTTVRVFLDSPMTQSLSTLVSRFVRRIPYAVEIHDFEHAAEELVSEPFDFRSEARFGHAFVEMPGSYGYAPKDLVFEGRMGFELHGRMRFYLLDREGRRYLRLVDAGNYSQVEFDERGRTLVVVKQLTPEVRAKLNDHLLQVRAACARLPGDARDVTEAILHEFERIATLLVHRHDGREADARWQALNAQVEVLRRLPSFQSHPLCMAVERQLGAARGELESFVTGTLRLGDPTGVITQDGIDITPMLDLSRHLGLGIGHIYNLDLCGEHRVSLNAARDAVLEDERLQRLLTHLWQRIGGFLRAWFAEEGVDRESLRAYQKRVSPLLAAALA